MNRGRGDLPLLTRRTMDDSKLIYLKNAGRMMSFLIWVKNDVCGITDRIKKIDPGFFMMFNPKTQKYELLHEDDEWTFNLEFNRLDDRVITEIYRTRRERFKKLEIEMESHNEKLKRDARNKRSDFVHDKASEVWRYGQHHESIDKIDDGAFATRWV